MAVGTVVIGITSIRLALVVRVDGAVGVDCVWAVRLEALAAAWAVWLLAAVCLGTYTDTVTDLDVLDILSDLDGLANNLVTNAACCYVSVYAGAFSTRTRRTVGSWAPARAEHVEVRTADTAALDLDIDIIWIWLSANCRH